MPQNWRILGALTGAVLVGVIGACCSTSNPAGAPGGFVPLFDGKTLNGWVQRGGKASYTVEDGCIVGRSAPDQPNSFLCTVKNYRDFELHVDFKVDKDLNSGIQIRSESKPDYQNGRVHGYQVEIDPSDRAWTGGLYDEARRGVMLKDLSDNPTARAAFKQGDWNHLRILCVGPKISTWINDVPGVEVTDSMTAEGFIGLQVHGVGDRKDPLEVRWRNLLIHVLN